MTEIGVRPLTADDVPAVERLLAAKRAQYESLSPRFWRPAKDAVALHELYVQWLVSVGSNLCLTTDALDAVLIATPHDDGWLIDDFAVASPAAVDDSDLPGVTIGPAPPVYDPGGPVAIVGDWNGDRHSLATLARALRGQCVLVVVPVDHADHGRQATARSLGFAVASIWYR